MPGTPIKLIMFAREFIQHGRKMYAVTINAAVLDAGLKPKIDTYDPQTNKSGYQRTLDGSRCEDIMKYISGPDSMIPNPILLNYRQEDGEIIFKPFKEGSPIGTITFKGLPNLWNFDGQYRQNGFFDAIESGDLTDDFELPVVICNVPRAKELELFLTLNATQKGVPTDLLIYEKVELAKTKDTTSLEWKSLPKAITKDMRWMAAASEIVAHLSKKKQGIFTGNIWAGRLRPPQVSDSSVGGRLPNDKYWFSASKMIQYIRPVATMSKPGTSRSVLPESLEERAVLVSNAWQALANIYPDAFSTDVKRYWMAWTHINMDLFYKLLPWVMRYMIEDKSSDIKEGSIPSVAEFEKVFRKCHRYKGRKEDWTWWDGDKGQVRHYHGRSNTKILLSNFKKDLGYGVEHEAPDEIK